jgi:hypothetical protein
MITEDKIESGLRYTFSVSLRDISSCAEIFKKYLLLGKQVQEPFVELLDIFVGSCAPSKSIEAEPWNITRKDCKFSNNLNESIR